MKKYITLTCLLLFFPVLAFTQTEKQNLTRVLKLLSESRNIPISFSPSLTDSIYIGDVDMTDPTEKILKQILKGSCLSFKLIKGRYYHIFKKTTDSPKLLPQRKLYSVPKPLKQHAIFHSIPLSSEIPPIGSCKIPVNKIIITRNDSLIPIAEFKKRPTLWFAIKTNVLYTATATLNLGFEFGLNNHSTLDISCNYNNWTYSDNRKMKHWFIQPEYRYWFCEKFNGHFIGIHTHFAKFNWGGMLPWGFKSGKMFGRINNKNIQDHRYQGWIIGAGISYGYQWILNKQWGMEASLGIGYSYIRYDKYSCKKCGEKLDSGNKHYIGPTKAAISLIYIIQ